VVAKNIQNGMEEIRVLKVIRKTSGEKGKYSQGFLKFHTWVALT
jgi:hypothetical protein